MTTCQALKSFTVTGVAALLLITVLPTRADTFDRGRELYDNHCRECHEKGVHLRVSRKVSTVEDLRKRVSGWSIHSGLEWSREEVGDVTEYLLRTYYQQIGGTP